MSGEKLTLVTIAALAAAGFWHKGSKSQLDLFGRGKLPKTITIADLSCGAGMASRGLLDGLALFGIRGVVKIAVDPWKAAVDSYRANIPEAEQVVQTTTEEALANNLVPKVDVVITGPPCVRDSVLARCRIDRLKPMDAQMATIKQAAREIGVTKGRMVVMETNRGWNAWGKRNGFSGGEGL